MQKSIDVVVLGLSPTGLYAVREAARAGYNVLGVGDPNAPGHWSRLLVDRIAASTPEARIEAILNRFPADAETKPVLIVTSDQDLEAVIHRADALGGRVHMQRSYQDGLAERIMDKDRFYKLCAANSVAYPTLWAASIEQAVSYRDQIAYPCIIKPARIQDIKHLMGGQKGWILKSAADFDVVLPRIPREAGMLLMQEIVSGPESEIMLWCGYIDKAGEIRQRFTARKLRQYPPGFGSASLVQSETCTEIAEIAERLLTSLGFHGIAAAEFKRHSETGQFKIIEVNPRPSLWFSVSSAADVPIVETAVAEATGLALPPMVKQRDGIRWRYRIKDLASYLFYARCRDFVLPAPDVNRSGAVDGWADVVGSRDDPMPVLGELWNFAYKGAARMIAQLGAKR